MAKSLNKEDFKRILGKNINYFKSYGHMIVYYLSNFSGAYLYIKLGIDYRHYKNKTFTAEWKSIMKELIDESFPETNLEKINALQTLDECEKDIVQL